MVTFKHQHSDSGNGMRDIFLSTLWTTKSAQAPFLPLLFYWFAYGFHNLLAGRGGGGWLNVRFEACVCELSFNLICCLPI